MELTRGGRILGWQARHRSSLLSRPTGRGPPLTNRGYRPRGLRDVVRHRWVVLVLLQAAALVRAGSAREISIPFIATLTGGHAIWLAYGIGIPNLPLIVTDSVGLAAAW